MLGLFGSDMVVETSVGPIEDREAMEAGVRSGDTKNTATGKLKSNILEPYLLLGISLLDYGDV